MGSIWYKVYDKYGKFFKKIRKEEEEFLKDGEYLKGVTCFVISKDGKVLIEKRVNKGLTPGANDLCSGHVDKDESPTHAILRELEEELGISREQYGDKVKSLSKEEIPLNFKSKGKICSFFIKFFMLQIPENSDAITITRQKSEVSDYEWVPMEEAFNLIREGKTKFPYDERFEPIFSKIAELLTPEVVREGI